ncbi:MAG TPA: TadE/TadG family type IV pilus assembly protein [Polyangiaceae bacterium]|nr:TadE/TadG family type IV pilus assembly protein [Polyangiaceae bacterium]
MTVEFVLLLPLLMLLMGVVIAGARVWWARATVTQLADSAARQASISRTAGQAQTSAAQLVRGDAEQTGVRCVTEPTLTLDTSGFGVPIGRAAEVRARVECAVPLSDVILPGLPGSLLVSGEAVSPLDRFRARG